MPSCDPVILTFDLWFWNFESAYFIQDEYRRIHFKARCCVTNVVVIIIIAYDLIGSVYQDSTINFKLYYLYNYNTRYYMCINCGLGRFLKPIVKSNFGWQHGHICARHFSFSIFQNCNNRGIEVTWWHRDLGKSWISMWCRMVLAPVMIR